MDKKTILQEIDSLGNDTRSVNDKFPSTVDTEDNFQTQFKTQDIVMREKILNAIHHEIESKKKLRKVVAKIVGSYLAIVTLFAVVMICLPKIDVKLKMILATVILGNTIGIITYFCKYAFSDSDSLVNLFYKINLNEKEDSDN